eukprot:scaffold12379_cov59-Phaeocystis_antarctica.AAC.2
MLTPPTPMPQTQRSTAYEATPGAAALSSVAAAASESETAWVLLRPRASETLPKKVAPRPKPTKKSASSSLDTHSCSHTRPHSLRTDCHGATYAQERPPSHGTSERRATAVRSPEPGGGSAKSRQSGGRLVKTMLSVQTAIASWLDTTLA